MKKRMLAMLLCMAMVLSLLPMAALAAGEDDTIVPYAVKDGNIYFDPSTGAITDCDTTVTSADIPDSINGEPVTSIGANAFQACSSLTSVTIPDGVTRIGYFAFYECSSLTNIKIPDSVTRIDGSVFAGCSNLINVTIPDSVFFIGDCAFSRCSSLTSVTIPDSVTSIGIGVFRECSSLTSVIIPDSITNITSEMFRGCSSLTSVTIPDSVTSIGHYAFYDCSSLTNMTIPDSVTSIGDRAFFACSSLANVKILGSVTYIGDYVFHNCSSLISVTILDNPNNTNNIYLGMGAFRACGNLTNVTIPNGVTSIRDYTFYACGSLSNVIIPDSVTAIGNYAFYGCYRQLTSITIPDSVTSIGSKAFAGCSSLSNVTIPNSVTSIGEGAFAGCSGLTNVTIPDGITAIADGAFAGCSSLTDVTIPDSVTAIGDSAFSGCSSLISITIPDSVISIGDSAFSGCSSLISITIPDSVISIGDSAFSGCSSLISITIPDSVISIGDSAFYGCSNLTDVYYAGTDDEWNHIAIGDDNECLTGAIIYFNSTGPVEVTTRTEYHQLKGHDAFTNTVIFEDGISYKWAHEDDWADIMALVGKWVYCTIEHSEQSGDVLVKVVPGGACGDNLTWTLENGILTISGSGEMDNWDDYTNTNAPWYADYNDIIGVVIENGVTSIGSSAFIGLTDCKSFSIGADVQSIGKCAFSSLSSNTKIKFNGNAPSIDTSAFADDLDGIDIYYNSEKGDWEKVIAQEYESIPSIAWIYSEDATENLAIENTLRFPNEATYFGGEENGYYISKNDYQTLLSNLNSKDKKAIESKKNINGEKNVYFYNVDRGTSSHFTWGGSCYGMSVLIALVNGGILSLSDFNTSADTLFAVDSTAETQSIINFYQGQQLLPFVTGIQAEFMTQQEQPAQIKKMEELVTDAQANGSVALISFAYKDETGQATRRDHTILGYAVERGTFKLQINDTPYLFDRRILTYDPAYSGDHQQYHNGAIYYNDTQWAMIGLYNVVSSTNGFNLNSESDTAQLKLVITDTNYINAVDYVTGETNFNSVAKNAYLYTGNSDFIVESIWGVDTVKNGLFDGAATIADNGAVIIGMDADTGNSGTMPFTVAFPHLDSTYTVTTANDTVDFALAYENYYLSANSDQPGTVTFEPNGKVIMTTDQTGTGYLSITANDGCSSLPWHTLDIVSKDTSKLALELTDTGILVAGDTLTDVTIYGTNDEETTELTFSTKAHSVLVASENNELVISEIPDKNSSSNSNNSTSSAFNPISISTSSNGTVSVNPKSAKAGNTVTITVVPDDGYGLDKLTVTDKNGSDIKLTDQGNGTYTFTMPASKVNISATFTALEVPAPVLPFTDVTTSDWFYDAVAYVYDNGLMTGTSATTFAPKATTTRGMIVTILHRLEGSPAAEASGFADVESGAWYQEAVDWAAANGIVNGTSQTTFAPTSPITREQMAAILYRYAAYKGYDVSQLADLSRFSDSSAVNTYAADALAWANAAGLITGVTDTTLSPQGSAVRAQAATILMRFCENIAQ